MIVHFRNGLVGCDTPVKVTSKSENQAGLMRLSRNGSYDGYAKIVGEILKVKFGNLVGVCDAD